MNVICSQASSNALGLDFHPSQPWLLYGTQKGTVRIVDYEAGSVILEISFSPDKVNCVSFHKKEPIFACGTDKSRIHLYNYRKNVLLFSFTDHLDSITSIDFHLDHPFLVSASVDGSSRIWNWQSRVCLTVLGSDVSPINCVKLSPKHPYVVTGDYDGVCRLYDISPLYHSSHSTEMSKSLFSNESPVNTLWENEIHLLSITSLSWHQTDPVFATVSSDSSIKIWSVNGSSVMSIGVLNSTMGPFASGGFHYPSFLFGAITQSGLLHFWESKNGKLIQTQNLVSQVNNVVFHPKFALMALGHTEGIQIHKLWKERPFYDCIDSLVVWTKQRQLIFFDTNEKKSQKAFSVHDSVSKVSLCPAKNFAVVSYTLRGKASGFFEVIDFKQPKQRKRWIGSNSVWANRTTLAALSNSKEKLIIIDMSSSRVKKYEIPTAISIFPGLSSTIYISSEKCLFLFDIYKEKIVNDAHMPFVKSVILDSKNNRICAHSGGCVYNSSPDLLEFQKVKDLEKIKSICWYNGIVLYTTRHHLKYFAGNINGIICTLQGIYYLLCPSNESLWFVTRSGTAFQKKVQFNEIELLQSIKNDNYNKFTRLLKDGKPAGSFIQTIAMKEERFDLALYVSSNDEDSFRYALMDYRIDIAYEVCQKINKPEIWMKLAEFAMKIGNIKIAETSYKMADNIQGLASLYLVTNQKDKMDLLATNTTDPLLMIWSNQDQKLIEVLKTESINISQYNNSVLSPKLGLTLPNDWPLLNSSINYLENRAELSDIEQWSESESNNSYEEGWDIQIEEDVRDVSATIFTIPVHGESIRNQWMRSSHIAGDLAASGDFSGALVALYNSISLMNFTDLKKSILNSFMASNCIIRTQYSSIIFPLSSNFRTKSVPLSINHVEFLSSLVTCMMSAFTKGKFMDCFNISKLIFTHAVFSAVNTIEDEKKVFDSIQFARYYSLAVILENSRKQSTNSRQLELALYITHLPLLPMHLRLTIQSALKISMKEKQNYTTVSLSNRLLELSSIEKVEQIAKQAISSAGVSPKDTFKLDYSEKNPFEICAHSLKPIFRGNKSVTCPLCRAPYFPEFKGQLCSVCQISKIGADCPGLSILRGK